ncbi:hypothetical protein GN303_02990 [Commensalibacter melissae]|uniref:Bacterioferritin-associated ferredoxin n=1 Tax=Commensalibacter melissae TaxID=2070537 RepID=A0A318NCG4_9PROT|nr:(2Fe-2S)-binding protein [Commensalibacter melissae]AYN86551.1 hypothetical protein D9V35_03110 [Commensalibacter melissae]PXZ00616.1 hypothetical protein DK869_04220 [Commensalibacter melissae]QGT68284.1 hypothetical protein GN303_02990 [Commensalibacter melissae]
MYICSCRALTDKDIGNAIKDGADCPSKIYKSCGSKPDCGRCIQRILIMLKEHRQNAIQP